MSKLTNQLADLHKQLQQQKDTYFGYPEIPDNPSLAQLGLNGLSGIHLNNAGDPWEHGYAKLHTKYYEQQVIDFFAKMYAISDDYWGYVTSGGTEGNLQGAYMGRELLSYHSQDKPIMIFSSSSHYSVRKIACLLNIPFLEVPSQYNGEMDYDVLYTALQYQNRPIVIFANLGTTMTGAFDNIPYIKELLHQTGYKEGDYYIHADGALGGLIYPFRSSSVNLFEEGLDSISISGHKFIGTIHPCGIFLTPNSKKQVVFSNNWVAYVGANDTTISGSRNGLHSLLIWYIIEQIGEYGFKQRANECIKNAQYLYEQLSYYGYKHLIFNPEQIIVAFDKPTEWICQRYQLATTHDLAHVICLPHLTQRHLDQFLSDLNKNSVIAAE